MYLCEPRGTSEDLEGTCVTYRVPRGYLCYKEGTERVPMGTFGYL